MERPLEGQVALVAGATRGAGRGIACMLGAAGATVICTGRSTREGGATPGRPETIEETAEMVEAHGGRAVAIRCDHTVDAEVEALIARIRAEHGRLDVLVNDIWGGDTLIDWSKRFWQLDMTVAKTLFDQALYSHMLTARHAAALMVEAGRGLIVEIGDGEHSGCRGQFLYDFCKAGVIRLAYAMAWQLRGTGVTALMVSPGFLRSEAILESYGVTEANWQEAAERTPGFASSETPFLVGRAVAALAADPNVADKAGGAYFAAHLGREYGFTDVDGRLPDFWADAVANIEAAYAKDGKLEERWIRFFAETRYMSLHREPAHQAEAARMKEILGLENLAAGQRMLDA